MTSKIITPLYSLQHEIHIVAEYTHSKSNPYCRVKIITHHLFDAKDKGGFQLIRRSRAVMTSVLGRMLLSSELVHHKSDDRTDDSPNNLELITPNNHNKHHKVGSKHSDESKLKISSSLSRAYKDGRKIPSAQKGGSNGCAKLTDNQVIEIRANNSPSRRLGAVYGVSKTVILHIKSRKTWRHL